MIDFPYVKCLVVLKIVSHFLLFVMVWTMKRTLDKIAQWFLMFLQQKLLKNEMETSNTTPLMLSSYEDVDVEGIWIFFTSQGA